MKRFVLAILLATTASFVCPSMLSAQTMTKPHTFSAGTPARAEEVNENFDILYSQTQRKHAGAVYRWATFNTYPDGAGWMMGNAANLFGGVNPSYWTDGSYLASNMSSDKEVLRTLFTNKGYGGKNANIISKVYYQYSSTNGQVVTALFRIKNTTLSPKVWTPQFYYTCYGDWGERASVAINGANAWNANTNCGVSCSTSVELTIPADRTSTVIFVSTTGTAYNIGNYIYARPLALAFFNDSLVLPDGLEYVDDLDIATGGWEQ